MISGHLNPKPCPSDHPNHDRWFLFVVSFWEQLSPPCPVWSGRRRSDLPPSTSFESESGRRSHPKSHTLGLVDCAGKRPGRAGAPPDCQTGQSAISLFDPSSLVPAALATLKQTGGPTSRGRRAASVTQRPFPCCLLERPALSWLCALNPILALSGFQQAGTAFSLLLSVEARWALLIYVNRVHGHSLVWSLVLSVTLLLCGSR